MWPLPPIHKSSAGHGWRAGLGGPAGGGCAGRGSGRKTGAPAGASLGSCVRRWEPRWAGRRAAGAVPGRGGSDGASCAAPSAGEGRGRSRERSSTRWRRSPPGGGGGGAAKDTCRLPRPRRAGASAQRPGAGLLRSGGAGSRAIYASAHLRAGSRPWLAAAGGREVAYGRGLLGAGGLGCGRPCVFLRRWQRTPRSGGAFFSEPRLAWARPLRGVAWRRDDPNAAGPGRTSSAFLRAAEPVRGA